MQPINWGGKGFDSYQGYMLGGGGPSQNEKMATSISQQDQDKKVADSGKVDSTLGQFEGPVEQSGFYNALKTSGIESTSRAYDDARANLHQQAHAAGFGYEQPITAGSDAQMSQSEASDMAQVPRQAMIAATQPALASASTRVGEENAFNPAATLSTAAQLEMDRKKRQAGLITNIAKLGAGIGTAFIPGVGPALSAGILSSGGGG